MPKLKLLTTAEIAKRMGLSDRSVQGYCKDGLLPATKLGRDWVVTEEDFDEFMAQRAKPDEKTQAESD